ncbi:hypothetical protein fugu_019634 [Takifugu bimaculatus]|uniref:Interferon-related developmental regulator N-terminal domain-containing protein n=1 Tax=Takifugu bimaculatus TaxID=433685 RepID=A0A4Z2BFW8_9TELE|nr:hypothetical protein fugu_019634 [Takifugu bimaculatus]
MPRTKKKNGRGGQNAHVQPFSDEDASIETLSHCSSFSDSTSVADEGGEASEDTAQEDFQYKLKGFIDSTVDKSAKTRQGALDGLKTAMATRILYEFISERRMTITDSIERCLKKGKGEEQRAAASLACLLCIQLGSGHRERGGVQDPEADLQNHPGGRIGQHPGPTGGGNKSGPLYSGCRR